MKKLFTILLAAFTIGNAYAQSHGNKHRASNHSRTSNRSGFARTAQTVTKQRLDSLVNETDKLVFTYDNAGNMLTQSAFERDDEQSPWFAIRKQNLTYNANNQLITTVDYDLDDDTQTLLLSGKEEYTYDSKGNISLLVDYFWDDDTKAYVYNQKEEDHFDANNHYIGDLEYNYRNNAWVYGNKDSLVLDSKGNDTLYIRQQWDDVKKIWFPIIKTRTTFDSNNDPLVEIKYRFNLGDQKWALNEKDEFTYDSHFNNTTYLTSTYDDANQIWTKDGETDYTYNLSYSLADIVGPNEFYAYAYVNNMITKETYYSFSNDVASLSGTGIYYYSPTSVTGVNDEVLGSTSLKVYPNPSSDFISIDANASNITITDLQGNTVLNQANTGSQISIKHLQNGLYIYKLTSNNSTSTGKLIKD